MDAQHAHFLVSLLVQIDKWEEGKFYKLGENQARHEDVEQLDIVFQSCSQNKETANDESIAKQDGEDMEGKFSIEVQKFEGFQAL